MRNFFNTPKQQTPTSLSPLEVCQAITQTVREHIPHSTNLSNDPGQSQMLENIIRHNASVEFFLVKLKQTFLDLDISYNMPAAILNNYIQAYKHYTQENVYLTVTTHNIHIDHGQKRVLKLPEIHFSTTYPSTLLSSSNGPTCTIALPAFSSTSKNCTEDCDSILTTELLNALRYNIGNCSELSRTAEQLLINTQIPELIGFMFAQISIPTSYDKNGNKIGDHVLTIVFKPNDLDPILESQFDSFEACCNYFLAHTDKSIIIDPWLSESMPVESYKKLLNKASSLGVSSNLLGNVEIKSLIPCCNPETCSPMFFQGRRYQEPDTYKFLMVELSPLTQSLQTKLNEHRRNIITPQAPVTVTSDAPSSLWSKT